VLLPSACPRTAKNTERFLSACALAWLLLVSAAHAQDACTADIDCDEDLVCMRVLFGVDCNDAGCLEVHEQGFCAEPSPDPLFCDDDDRCPTPLYCDVDNPNGPLCGYVEPMCSTDDDECPTGFMCVDLEPLGGCSLCDDGPEGSSCTPAPCAENNLNVCSPIPMSCEEDGDCAEGFVCGEIGPFDLQTGWDESVVGTQGCLSIGLIALTDGVVRGGEDVPDGGVGEPMGGSAGSAGSSGAGDGGTGGAAGAGAGESGAAGSGGAAGMDMTPAPSGGDSGGCSVGAPGSSRALAVAMLLALLCGTLLLRRWPVG
jgi:hypothetical protein